MASQLGFKRDISWEVELTLVLPSVFQKILLLFLNVTTLLVKNILCEKVSFNVGFRIYISQTHKDIQIFAIIS